MQQDLLLMEYERGETVYGINTGFGALVKERISVEDLADLQTNLIR